jgi:hypothetical protein
MANNQASENTGSSPFFANKEFDPYCQFDLSLVGTNDINDQRALMTSKAVLEIHNYLHTEINRANLHHQGNENNRWLPMPNYQNGDLIWLNGYNWKTRWPSKKLDNKWDSPFKIIQKISPYTYRIELPPSIECYNVFHGSLWEPATDDAYPRQNMEPPPLVEIDGEDEYFIEAILDSWIHRRKLQYLIKCISYDEPDWEPAELHSESEAIDTFHKRYPDKLGPLSTQL